ncbi:MAG TPA: transposase [Planctomycetota bacterium]|nr:transposase [Planctomycetota bacterium]
MAPSPTPAAPWRLSDLVWRRIEIVLDALDPPKRLGRPRADRRLLLEGILYRIRTGRAWRSLPKAYGDDSTAHRTFHRWDEAGILSKIRDLVSVEHPEMKDLRWAWEPPSGSLGRLKRAL